MYPYETIRSEANNRGRVSVIIPVLFVLMLFFLHFIQWGTQTYFSVLGVNPREWSGLVGILFAPFLHGSWAHLFSNAIPLLVLGNLIINFYGRIAYKVILWIWLVDGLGVWIIGREAYHIGASGLIYGLASFLFFSGIIRKNRRLQALSLAVVFIYGGMIWGMFPTVFDISWEAHLMGFLSGIFLALVYLRKGPSDDPVPEWMNEDEGEETKEEVGNDKNGKTLHFTLTQKDE